VFLYFNWQPNEDYDATYNFRDLIIDAISDPDTGDNDLEARVFVGFNRQNSFSTDFDLTSTQGGFILDLSMLDVDVLADDRARVRVKGDINRTGRNILIGLFQDELGAKLRLIASQLNFSKNGNSN